MHRQNALFLFLIFFLCIGLWLPRLRGPLDLRYDAGVYYILGTSIAEGKGYRLLNEPGEIEAIQYPPLLPVFAAICQRIAGTSDPAIVGVWLRYTFALLFTAYMLLIFLLSKRYLTPGFSFLSTCVVIFQVYSIWLSDLFFTELPFAFISILFIYILKEGGKVWPKAFLASGLGISAFLLRTSGIALLAAWVGEGLLKKRFRVAALRGIIALLPILAWTSYVHHVKNSEEYIRPAYPYQRAHYQFYNVGYLENISFIDPFQPELGKVSPGLFAKRILTNLTVIPAGLGEAVSARAEWSILALEKINQKIAPAYLPLWLVGLFLNLLGAIVLAGMIILAFRGEWLIPLYTAGSILLICTTPWPGQFERYLAPLTPLLSLSLFLALSAALTYLKRHRLFFGFFFVLPVLVGIFLQETVSLTAVYTTLHESAYYEAASGETKSYRLFFFSDAWASQFAAMDWLEDEAKPGEVVATSTPHSVFLKTGLFSVMPPFEPDPFKAQMLIDSVPVDYLIIDDLEFINVSRQYAAPLVKTHTGLWKLVYGDPDRGSRIYKRVGRATAGQ